MTQEEKDLLLKDLCARIPYGVKCIVTKSRTEEGQKGDVGKIVNICLDGVECIDTSPFFSEFGNFKTYLFPLSSMTEEQAKIFLKLESMCFLSSTDKIGPKIEFFDWLNRNHFDYRGLIEKGLAIDATNLNIY
jgi:hypothetical protein